MLVHAVHFFHHKDSRARVWRPFERVSENALVLQHRIYFAPKKKKTQSSPKAPTSKTLCWDTHVSCTNRHIHDTNSLSRSRFLHSSWAWRSPWLCSTTSTERGRSMTLSFRGRHPTRGAPLPDGIRLWFTPAPPHQPLQPFRASFAPPTLPFPCLLYRFQLCPHSALLSLFTIHFAKE